MRHKRTTIFAIILLFAITSATVLCASMRNAATETAVLAFTDVDKEDWFYADAFYVSQKGLMQGTSETEFSPQDTTTRAMAVTVLWRLEGKPDGKKGTFSDVESDAYYEKAVQWAYENQIVTGYSADVFGTADFVTREQLAAIFYRYADFKGYDTAEKADLTSFPDCDAISPYAVSALSWANAKGIITGVSADVIEPQGYARRCQIAAMLRRFYETYSADNAPEHERTVESAAKPSGGRKQNSTKPLTEQDTDTDTQTAAASDMPLITVSDVSALPGEDVQIITAIRNNPGILGMTLTVSFDETALTLTKAENGEAFRGILDFTPSKTLSSGTRFVWDGVDLTADKIKDGDMLTMQFHVSEHAAAGTYPVTLNFANGDIVDNNLQEISVSAETGYITVKNEVKE